MESRGQDCVEFNSPPSAWNGVRHHAGTLSAISMESCPPSRGIRMWPYRSAWKSPRRCHRAYLAGPHVEKWAGIRAGSGLLPCGVLLCRNEKHTAAPASAAGAGQRLGNQRGVWEISPVDDGAAVRVDAVRYAITWSDGFLTVTRSSCTDRALKNFAALHRLRWLTVMEAVTHLKRQKPQRLLAAAFDICFDKCCLLKF